MVKAAKEKGHLITLFNRGITNPDLFSELPLVKGDREKGVKAYAPLKTKKWDVIIDDCLNWHKKQGDSDIISGHGEMAVGMDRARELEVIMALKCLIILPI